MHTMAFMLTRLYIVTIGGNTIPLHGNQEVCVPLVVLAFPAPPWQDACVMHLKLYENLATAVVSV